MNAGSRRARLEAFFTRIWQRRGPWACALLPLASMYGAVVALRRAAYRHGWLASLSSSVPVIVVGNRVVGGAGKTPTVLAVVEHLQAAGWLPGIVTRGYGRAGDAIQLVGPHARADEVGDEPLLLQRRSGVPVVVGRSRSAAAAQLLRAHPAVNVLVADDGLQHLAWSRDIEIVVFDARGAANGWLLPAGPMREPIDTPTRGAAQLTLYTDGRRSTALPGFVAERSLRGVVRLSDWQQAANAARQPFAVLGPEPVHACAGIAHPERFFDMLRAQGLPLQTHALADHADYSALPWPETARQVLVTEKDATKLDPARLARERPASQVWVAPLDFQIEPGFWDALTEALRNAAAQGRPPAT